MVYMGKERACSVPCVHITDRLDGFAEIKAPDCPAVIWQRALDPAVQNWLDQLSTVHLPKARVIIRPDDIRQTVEEICDASGTPDCPQRQRWIEDVVGLTGTFVALTSAPYLRLRLDVVTTNACKKFHIDYLTARMICTYRGRGTQYGYAHEGAAPEEIFHVPTGAPLLMRGRHWPNTPTSTLKHRSPPIEGTGETRLVLVFDPVDQLPQEKP